MSQVLVLLLYVIWATVEPDGPVHGRVDPARLMIFLGGFVVIVLAPALIVRIKVRPAATADPWMVHRQIARLMTFCRGAIVAWFFGGVYGGSTWVEFVGQLLEPLRGLPVSLPGMLLGPLPPLLAWVGLWWAQFPADRIARENSFLPLLERNFPVHQPPTLASFMDGGLRMQILATSVPLLLIALVRDLVNLTLLVSGWANPRASGMETVVSISAALVVLIIAPEPLRRIFKTTPLPKSTLRHRLDALCKSTGTRYRELLLWNTGYAMGNAAVMGLLPQIRYVMLSDLLLETMTDLEIEAVFAHELGHIVHRHTIWYVVFFVVVFVLGVAVEMLTGLFVQMSGLSQWQTTAVEFASITTFAAGAIYVFGVVSRRLERQADVYAARVIQQTAASGGGTAIQPQAPVGEAGAAAIAAALYRAASVNHLPVAARSFRHGSIAKRVRFIQNLAATPSLTRQFDRSMLMLNGGLLTLLVIGLIWVSWQVF